MAYQIDELKNVVASLMTFGYSLSCCSHIEIGLGLIAFGIFFTFLGVVLFFDKGLLALGNIFWLTGVTILLGWQSMLKLLSSRANYKGSLCFVLGLFFLFVRWPLLGIILEIGGCFLLFGGFWPTMRVFLSQIPGVGWALSFLCPSD